MLAPFTSNVITGTGLVIGCAAVADTVSVTEMFWEDPAAPVLVEMTITPAYVPAARPVGFTLTFKLAGAEPLIGLTASQPVLEAIAVKARLAPPDTASRSV
jgi:hypothetical protein